MAKKALKSKFFRIGVEGDTTDGREIQAAWLEQMARNYNPEKYGARINCEHIRGLAPDGSFSAFGDVLALKTDTVEIDGENKLALLAQICPNDDLLTLNKARKKVYTSMEIDPNFADSGEAYLTGLAVTDSPASLGTEILQFAAHAEHNPLADRKQKAENLFSAAREVDIEFQDSASLVDRVKAMFSHADQERTAKDIELTDAIEAVAQELVDLKGRFAAQKTPAELTTLNTQVAAVQAELADLKQQLETTPNFAKRPAAAGGNNEIVTDC